MRKVLGILVLLLALALLTSPCVARSHQGAAWKPALEGPSESLPADGGAAVVSLTGVPGGTGDDEDKEGDPDEAGDGQHVAVSVTRLLSVGNVQFDGRLWLVIMNSLVTLGGLMR
jgi:hypothetical protein